MIRRHAYLLLLAWAAAALPAAHAQDFPSKPLRLIVPFGAGGSGDLAARTMAEALGAQLRQPVVVENRPGAGGTIGTNLAAKTPADGYTLVFAGTPNFAINPTLYGPATGGNPAAEFTAVALFASAPNVILTPAEFPAQNLGDFVRIAKEKPGQLNVTTGSVGSSGHLAGALLATRAGIDWVYVPHANPTVPLLAGVVQAGIYTVPATLQLIRSGKLRALAVTSAQRSTSAPDIPTVAELGYPGFEAIGWYGFAVPRGTPDTVVQTLANGVKNALAQPAIRDKLLAMGNDVTFMAPREFGAFMDAERTKWGEMVRKTGAKPD